MKTSLIIGINVITLVIAFFCGLFTGRSRTEVVPPHLTLEQILSIRELHLVKHTYNDLFFLHRNNDPRKPIRAIVFVPVEITAYLNLKEIELIKKGDSVKQIVLPRARLNQPLYEVDKMVFRETRSLQVHIGKDLYPVIGNYVQSLIANRIDSVKQMAVTQRILVQAEVEGKQYIEVLLRSVGRADIQVIFKKENPATLTTVANKVDPKESYSETFEAIPFGFIPSILLTNSI
jgi:hypothetical protein